MAAVHVLTITLLMEALLAQAEARLRVLAESVWQ